MSSYSTVIVVGRAGAVPEPRKTSSGKAMATFRLAVSRWEGADRGEVTDWFSIVAFENTAETALRFVGKGDLVLVEGRLQARAFQDREGKEQQRVEIVAGRLRLFPKGQREANGRADGASGTSGVMRAPTHPQAHAMQGAEISNLPF